MSTSPRRAVSQSTREKGSAIPAPFPYDAISGLAASEAISECAISEEKASAARTALARAEGRRDGEAQSRRQFEDQLAKERSAIAATVEQFAHDRATYFERVEGEVVQLALSIARKIMQRESQIDPLLLAAMAHVALEKIDGATEVTLRIHPQCVEAWTRFFGALNDQHLQPKIVGDPSQPLDACKLETSMGTAVLGTEVQLKEIERGFMDLLAARPGATR
ncbi:MAG TPA: FliH/SctL family protein [Candidatus Acidoferrales bacterium]|nr:FliH/SctL family protein [Candidatus Acidoferrales bacterium]